MRCKLAVFFLLTALLSSLAFSQQPVNPSPNPAPLPVAQPAPRPVIGLALEGGGALGLAHIGVLHWMEENHIPVDRLAGTSMGALIGGLYAEGMKPEEIERLASSQPFLDVFTLQSPYNELSFRRRQDRHEIPQSLTVGLRHGL